MRGFQGSLHALIYLVGKVLKIIVVGDVPGKVDLLVPGVDGSPVLLRDQRAIHPSLHDLQDEISLLRIEGLPSLLALWTHVVVDRQAAVDHVCTEGRSLTQQHDGVLFQLALSDDRVKGLTDADELLLAHQLLEAPAVVPLDVGL